MGSGKILAIANPAAVVRHLLESSGCELSDELKQYLANMEVELEKPIDGSRKIHDVVEGRLEFFVPTSMLTPEMIAAVDAGKTFTIERRFSDGTVQRTTGVQIVRTEG